LTAPAHLNGKPDLSGPWQAERTSEREYATVLGNEFAALQLDTYDLTKNVLNIFWGLKSEEVPPSARGSFDPQASPAKPARVSPHSMPSG